MDGEAKDVEGVAWESPLEQVLRKRAGLEGALLPILHDLMAQLGWIPPATVPRIAEALGLSRAEVHGVITYYADFRSEPPTPHTIEVCRAEACRARGSEAIHAQLMLRLGCAAGSPSDEARSRDGRIALRDVYCLGLCASGPALRVDGAAQAAVSLADCDALIERLSQSDSPRSDTTRMDPVDTRATRTGGSARVFVPLDSAALAVGADSVAAALAAVGARRGIAIELVRTSSRGAVWLEPLVEVEIAGRRIGYGPVAPDDVPGLFDSHFISKAVSDRAHPLALGPLDALPFLARQRRMLFGRAGRTRPDSLDDYRAEGGGRGLAAALASTPEAIRAAVLESGLRGRGGAAFPAGIKWKTVAETQAAQRHVVCNADEGDSGTFADRMLLEGDPFSLIEGMTIAGLAVGATKGFVYVRSEYPEAIAMLARAIDGARAAGLLGPSVQGSGRAFELELRVGAGSYVCGEETAMLESLEGRRGIVRAKPPLPAVAGLFGRPTLIQNVLTFAAVPTILAEGAAAYRALGVGRSTGTMPFQLAGNVRFGGLVELPFGVTLRELVFGFGGGTASGRPVKAIQVGGPLGCYVPEARWDEPLDYERYASFGAGIGHGGIVVHDDSADLAGLARHAMAFCARESCGKCTPCRIGSTRGVELIDRIRGESSADARAASASLLRELCTTMVDASLCAMGGMTPLPVLSALEHYAADFGLSADPDSAEHEKAR